ncbi:MAG: hypothetical protein R6X20_12700 [Phycisphaerae bacterium]
MEFQGPEAGELVAGGIGLILTLLIMLGSLILGIIIWWKIFSKAGYSGALGLLMLVPIANLIMLLVLAFGTWPIHEELERLKMYRSRPQ